MAKFAKKMSTASTLRKRIDAKKNLEGGLSFEWDPKYKLYMRAATSLIQEPTFYKNFVNGREESNFDTELINDIKAVAKEEPEFILKLAHYARHSLYLRSVPMLLCGEASQIKECKPFLKKWIPHVINRADEPCELMAYIINAHDRTSATSNNPLKKAISLSLDKFDEYQFSKYNRKGSVKLKDVLRIVHPKHKPLYSKIIEDSLKPPLTWENILSNYKNYDLESKKAAWEYLIDKNKLPYMASLRNLRNLLHEGISEDHLNKVLEKLTTKEAVLNSKQLPFRYLSAYKEIDNLDIRHSGKVLDALEDAIETSIENIPKLSGKTFMAADVSGSMEWANISGLSGVTYKELALVLMSMANKFCNDPIISIFGSEFRTVHARKTLGILENAKQIGKFNVGHATYGYKAIEHLLKSKEKVDRILVFTDMEMYSDYETEFTDAFTKYKRTINPDVKLYVFNLASYGNVIIPKDEKNVCLVSGWSDKIFNFINTFEKEQTESIEIIENERPNISKKA